MRFGLAPFDRDERLVETERILALMMESRGTTYMYLQDPHYVDFLLDEINCDLMPSPGLGLMPTAIGLNSLSTRNEITTDGTPIRPASKLAAILLSPTTLARGSPTCLKNVA